MINQDKLMDLVPVDIYLEYIEAIDKAAVTVSNWEANFIENMLSKRPPMLSPKQRIVIEQMAEKYLWRKL